MYRVIFMWENGETHSEIFANWGKVVEQMKNFTAKDRREIAVLTVVRMTVGE